MDKIQIIIDQAGIIIENTKESKSYIFDMDVVNKFIKTSVDYIFLLAGCVVVLIISVLKERGVQIRVAVAAKPKPLTHCVWPGSNLHLLSDSSC